MPTKADQFTQTTLRIPDDLLRRVRVMCANKGQGYANEFYLAAIEAALVKEERKLERKNANSNKD